jgi:hypothetical protein
LLLMAECIASNYLSLRTRPSPILITY